MKQFSRAIWTTSAIAFLFIFELLFSTPALSQVEPPNYNFSLDQFSVFIPGQSLEAAMEKHGNALEIKSKGGLRTHRFSVEHLRYKFPVLAQSRDGKITDFFARLPAYFLHDVFHQSIINRIGPQDTYKKVEEQAVYVWTNKEGLNHVYSGACSITCFPVYYAVYPVESDIKNFKPLVKTMSEQEISSKF